MEKVEDIVIKEIEGPSDECERIALKVAHETSRETLPVRVFTQGPRTMVSAVMPIRMLTRVLDHNATEKGSTADKAVTAYNRPIDKNHVKEIKDYLASAMQENRPFIIPPLTINATAGFEVYVPKGRTGPVTGWGILPDEQRLIITDGQHRFVALKELKKELLGSEIGSHFMNNGVVIMITLSDKIEQVHQDFADAAKTKPLPPSLVAIYDMRHPGNQAVMQLIERVSLFCNRVDATSTTLSINSNYVFLVNQIRQFVKCSLTGRAAVSDDDFYKTAKEQLNDPIAFDDWVNSRITILEVLTELIPEWNEVAALPKPGGADGPTVYREMRRIREERDPVSLTAAALSALALVSYHILHYQHGNLPTNDELKMKLTVLSEVDWRKSAIMWQGNLVQNGRVSAHSTAVKEGAKKILEVLGMDPQAISIRTRRRNGLNN